MKLYSIKVNFLFCGLEIFDGRDISSSSHLEVVFLTLLSCMEVEMRHVYIYDNGFPLYAYGSMDTLILHGG